MSWITVEKAHALDLIQELIRDAQEVEFSVSSNLNIRIRPANKTEPKQQNRLIDLQKHCAQLSNLLGCSQVSTKQPHRQVQGEVLDWLSAVEWLHIASSIDCVEVDTSRFDDSVMWCGLAGEFESKRSELLSCFATQLTVFSFVWGGFETIAKLIDPPRVPKEVKSNSSLVDAAIFYLKNEYDPMPFLAFYDSVLADLRQALEAIPDYDDLSEDFRIQPFMGFSGVGLHIVRKVRNRFAHGTMRMPMPDGWNGTAPLDVELIGLSTRIVLLTIQMLLLAYFKNDQFTVDCLVDEWGIPKDEYISDVLKKLHLQLSTVDED